MSESSEGLLGTWAPPQCPFQIAYSLRTLDDIRLAVTEAFFSLPHGGVEIGGILLGKGDSRQVTILDHVPLACDHALGPSFTLSPRDLTLLSRLLEEARKNTPDLQPVGWYHSHTRSEIFLSGTDLEIQNRYFSAPWQVALVLKPHTFQPTRAGFFFREAGGGFHAEATYQEFELGTMPLQPVPAGIVPPPADTGNAIRLDSLPLEPEPERETAPADPAPQPPTPEAPATSHEHSETPADDIPIHFPDLDDGPHWQIPVILGLAACLSIGVLAFDKRQFWLPRIGHNSALVAPQAPASTSLGLVLSDHDGQMRIGWDRKAPAVHAATRGLLEISSGVGPPAATYLDTGLLQSGSFIVKREAEKVGVTLSVEGPSGELGRESVAFLGRLPEPPSAVPDPAIATQRDTLAAEVERLKSDLKAQVALNQQLQKAAGQRTDMAAEIQRLKDQLNAQIARTRDLEKTLKPKDDQIARLRIDLNLQMSHNRVLAQSLDEAQAQLKLQQKKRLNNQNADPAK